MLQFIDYMNFSQDEIKQFNICLQAIREATFNKNHLDLCDIHNQHENVITDFFTKFAEFLHLMNTENELYKYINTYCEMVEVLLHSIMADRSNNFELHLLTTRQMLPYFFSMNHT